MAKPNREMRLLNHRDGAQTVRDRRGRAEAPQCKDNLSAVLIQPPKSSRIT